VHRSAATVPENSKTFRRDDAPQQHQHPFLPLSPNTIIRSNMSSPKPVHRKSDVGVPKAFSTKGEPRRATIDGRLKESSAEAPTAKQQPFHHHNTPVSLGSVTSYYFKGAPQTPVQKLVRSEQQKLLLQASMSAHEDEENTTGNITMMNQSYLSSSSSSDGGNNTSRGEDMLNTSVLSDTTELTASHFVILAATHRTTAEKEHRKSIAATEGESHHSLKAMQPPKENEGDEPSSSQRRRQSITEGIVKSSKDKVARRRETLSGFVPSKQTSRNKLAEFQRRQSEGAATVKRRNSKTPSAANDTMDLLLMNENALPPTPANTSIRTPDKNLSQSPAKNTRSSTKKSAANGVLPLNRQDDSFFQSPSKSPSKPQDSPARNTRSSSAKKKHSASKKSPQQKGESDEVKMMAYSPQYHQSPARSTRSTTKKRDETVTIGNLLDGIGGKPDIDNSTVSLGNLLSQLTAEPGNFEASPARITRTSSEQKMSSTHSPKPQEKLVDSPARNTRSAQKKLLSTFNNDASQLTQHDTTLLNKEVDSPTLKTCLAQENLKYVSNNTADEPKGESTDRFVAPPLNMEVASPARTMRSVEKDKSIMDTSEDSTASMGDILNDYLTDGDKADTSSNSGNLSSHDLESRNSLLLQSNVSKASTIETPFGMPREAGRLANDSYSIPHSPPSTIRMPAIREGISPYTDASDLQSSSIGQSPLRKALTPSNLAPSPRRFIHSSSQKKTTFKPSQTPSRLPPSPLRLPNQGNTRSASSYRSSLSPARLQQSPVRPKRSLVDENDASPGHVQEATSAFKRQKTFESLQDLVKEPYLKRTSTTPNLRNLQSVLRLPGQQSVRSTNTKRVGFRSPTFAEFNKSSPAENLTPLIKKTPRFSLGRDEHTNESPINVEGAGMTPFAPRMNQQAAEDSDMSVDSMSFLPTDGEPTVTLEVDMSTLLKEAPEPKSSRLVAPSLLVDEDNTMELETDINALLHLQTSNTEDLHINRRSLVFEDEPTTELESNMNALFDDTDSEELQPPIASRRFSIAPPRRLSISLDGSFDHEKMTNEAVEADMTSKKKDNLLDLKVKEVLDPKTINLHDSTLGSSNDILVAMDQFLRTNGMSGTIDIFARQVMDTIANQTGPELDLDSMVPVNEEDFECCMALQQYVRSGNTKAISGHIHGLAQSINKVNKYEWLDWLISATEHLTSPMEEKHNVIDNEIHRIDELLYDAEQCLSSIAKKSVRKARRSHLETRMVRRGVSIV
jgi:hypothetical protein